MQHFTSPQQPRIFSFGVTPCCLASLTLTGPMLLAPLQVAQQSGSPQVSHPLASPDRSINRNSLKATRASYARSRPALDRSEVYFLVVVLVLYLDVRAVEGDVAAYELHAPILWSLASFLASSLTSRPSSLLRSSVLVVFLRDDPDYVVGFGVRLAAAGRQGDAPDKLPHLGRDDHRVPDPEVEVPRVAEPGYAPARDPDVDEPREGMSIFRRMRDNVTSRVASGETLYASAARASPRERAAAQPSRPPDTGPRTP